MSGQGHNAAAHLRSFLERIERLEEERKTIADDIADVYKELVGEGYDKDAAKIVLKIRKSKDGIEGYTEKSGVVDAYLAALGMLPDEPRAPAPARARENIEEFPPHDPDTGELAEQKSGVDAEGTSKLRANGGVSVRSGSRPGGSEASDKSGADCLATPPAGSGSDEIPAPHSNPQLPVVDPLAAETGVGASVAAAPLSSEAFEPVKFLRKTAADYRPHCMNPTACAASGLKHCHACAKAAGELEPAA